MVDLARIDKENDEFYNETFEAVFQGKFKVKDVLGFDLKKSSVLILELVALLKH